MSSVISDLFTG